MVKQKWGCIYRLTNTTNGMKYIGKTVQYRQRMGAHKNSKNKHYVSRAIRKYGWDAFKQEILIDDVPEEDLDNLEISYIEVENTMVPNGYNLTRGGRGISGYTWSEELKKMQSQRSLQFLSKRKQFGCVHFAKKEKKWLVKSARPEMKHIGFYLSETKAREALKLYNETGKRMESDRVMRKKGHIKRTPNGRYEAQITKNKKRKVKTFDSVKECEEFFKNYRNDN
jgi:group I intron endonuclease